MKFIIESIKLIIWFQTLFLQIGGLEAPRGGCREGGGVIIYGGAGRVVV